MFTNTVHVVRSIVATENSSKNLGVQRLQTAIHHFREIGVIRDVPNRNSGFGKALGRAASAVDFDSLFVQSTGEFGKPRFVADTYQRSFDT